MLKAPATCFPPPPTALQADDLFVCRKRRTNIFSVNRFIIIVLQFMLSIQATNKNLFSLNQNTGNYGNGKMPLPYCLVHIYSTWYFIYSSVAPLFVWLTRRIYRLVLVVVFSKRVSFSGNQVCFT